jgi:hypothetical protein
MAAEITISRHLYSICMKLEIEHETPLMCPWTMSMELHQYFTEHEVCNPITMSLNNEYGTLSICPWTMSMELHQYFTEHEVCNPITMSLNNEYGSLSICHWRDPYSLLYDISMGFHAHFSVTSMVFHTPCSVTYW